MFYRTQIKSVTDFGVVDMAGKKLRFVGYLPVKAGDFVFTDGTFIFGNVPPRGSPATFGEDPAGIPVLGDDLLRGYFSRNGIFKNYPVKQDNWLVNSDKKFAHGSEDNVIDAELADDGSLLTVEKNPVQILDNDITSDFLFYHYEHLSGLPPDDLDYYSMMYLERRTRGSYVNMSEYQSWWVFHGLDDTGDFDYYRNALPEVQQTGFDSGGKLIPPAFIPQNKLIKDCEIIIKKDGEDFKFVNLSDLVKTVEESAMDSITIPLHLNADQPNVVMFGSVAMLSRAALKNFKIMPDASWQALFLIEIGAENYWNLETDFPASTTYGFLPFATSAVHSLFLFKVDSAGNYTKLADRSFFMPLWMIQNVRWNAVTTRNATHPADVDVPMVTPFDVNPTTFPYEDWWNSGWSWHWEDFFGARTGYDYYFFTLFTVYDSRLMDGAPEYNKDIYNINSEFYFPVQDNFRANFINAEDDVDKWTLGGVIDAQNKEVIGAFLPDETDAHTWNMGCASLNGGSYLFGIHDKALYKIDSDANISLVGDNLKNFRLRELKKISKARR